jgi:hypothetical protein
MNDLDRRRAAQIDAEAAIVASISHAAFHMGADQAGHVAIAAVRAAREVEATRSARRRRRTNT